MNIVDVIREETANKLHRIALRQGNRQVSYAELFERVDKAAHCLSELPIEPYMRVALHVPEGIDYIVLKLSILSVRGVVVPVPLGASERDVDSLIQEMRIDVMIFDPRLITRDAVRFDLQGLTGLDLLAVCRFDPALAEQDEFEALNPAFVRFTSGTTGKSKGVVISHEAICARTDAADQGLKMTDQDVVLWVLSMSFHFVVTILLFLRRGCEIVLCEHDVPRGIIEGLQAKDATFIYALPLHYDAMANSRRVTPSLCRHVRMAVSTTVSLSESTAQSFAAKFGFPIAEAYGIIEVGLPFVNRPDDARAQSVGALLPAYQVYLQSPDADGVGIVNLKGPGMFDAYLSPWQTRGQVTNDGWFETGDLGRLDDQGFLSLLGRRQNVINFMGMKIFPQEVERVVNQHPAIRESCVYGMAHDHFGQIPCARVVLRDVAAEIDPTDLRRFCYQFLAVYKVPKKFEVVVELEKTLTGKTVLMSRNTPEV